MDLCLAMMRPQQAGCPPAMLLGLRTALPEGGWLAMPLGLRTALPQGGWLAMPLGLRTALPQGG